MGELRSANHELADRVTKQISIDLSLTTEEANTIRELILAGKKQDQGWYELTAKLAKREVYANHGSH